MSPRSDALLMTDTRSWCVSSVLFVGSAPTNLSGLFVDTADPHYALRVMRRGASVVVPSLELAAEVLRLAGRSEDEIAFDIGVAKGEVDWDGTF